MKIVEIYSTKYSRLLPDGTYETRASFTYRTDTEIRGTVDLPLAGLTEEKVRKAIEEDAMHIAALTPKPFEVPAKSPKEGKVK